jgi:transglutaminase-like putative cysteine protease
MPEILREEFRCPACGQLIALPRAPLRRPAPVLGSSRPEGPAPAARVANLRQRRRRASRGWLVAVIGAAGLAVVAGFVVGGVWSLRPWERPEERPRAESYVEATETIEEELPPAPGERDPEALDTALVEPIPTPRPWVPRPKPQPLTRLAEREVLVPRPAPAILKPEPAAEALAPGGRTAPGSESRPGPPHPIGAEPSFGAIDAHALRAARNDERSIATLAAYLIRPARNDRERVRAFFRWITSRIVYDIDSFLQNRTVPCRAEMVLETRLSICQGYASLFEALCERAGIEVMMVPGFAKGFGSAVGASNDAPNHVWNAVRFDGRWHLIDTTWGAGVVDGGKYVRRFNDFYFLTPPDCLVFSHLPEDPRWQLTDPPLERDEFFRQPKVDDALFRLGVTPAELRREMQRKGFRNPVKATGFFKQARVHRAPLSRDLDRGRSYRFAIESPDFLEMAVIQDGDWQPLERRGHRFEATIEARSDSLRVAAKYRPEVFRAAGLATAEGGEDAYWDLLSYRVRPDRGESWPPLRASAPP